MAQYPKPPDAYVEFTQQFPQLAEAWRLTQVASAAGPLDEKAQRLLKLAVSVGNMREGAVHSAVRKAVATGATKEEIHQVLVLAASILGFPATVAVYTWVRDELDKKAE